MINVKIVPGSKDYLPSYIELVKSTGEEKFNSLFGMDIDKTLRALFFHHDNLFSHKYSIFAIVKNKIAGLIQSYGGDLNFRSHINTGYLILKNSLRNSIINFKNLIKANFNFGPINRTDYYIEILSVKSSFRRKGVANYLINYIEKRSKLNGYNRLVLDVEKDNFPAFNLYKKNDFKIHNIFKMKSNSREFELKKMIKSI